MVLEKPCYKVADSTFQESEVIAKQWAATETTVPLHPLPSIPLPAKEPDRVQWWLPLMQDRSLERNI